MSQRWEYEKGELQWTRDHRLTVRARDEDDELVLSDPDGPPRSDDPRPEPLCWLPHSCDQWVIGSREAALELIADLQEFVDRTGGGT